MCPLQGCVPPLWGCVPAMGPGPLAVYVGSDPPHYPPSPQEEEDTKPKPTKRKRKGSSAVGSDSD